MPMKGSPFLEIIVDSDLEHISPICLKSRPRKCAVNDKHLMSYMSEQPKRDKNTIAIWSECLLLNGQIVVTSDSRLGHILVWIGLTCSTISPGVSIG